MKTNLALAWMVLLAVSLLSLSFPDPYLVHKAVIVSEITQICAVHCLFRVRLSDFRGKTDTYEHAQVSHDAAARDTGETRSARANCLHAGLVFSKDF